MKDTYSEILFVVFPSVWTSSSRRSRKATVRRVIINCDIPQVSSKFSDLSVVIKTSEISVEKQEVNRSKHIQWRV